MVLRSDLQLKYYHLPNDDMSHSSLDSKKVLKFGAVPGKRIVLLRTYYLENKEERRGTLLSLFKSEHEYQERVEQIVSVSIDITVAADLDKKLIDFRLDKYLTVYQKTYKDWLGDLADMMVPCANCDRPLWGLAGTIIASIPLDRVYYHNICQCSDNLLRYCTMSPDHRNIYYALVQHDQDEIEKPFISEYVEDRPAYELAGDA